MLSTAGIVPAVITAIETESGRPVGHSRIPGTETEVPTAPWAIVYQLRNEDVRPTSYTEDTYDMTWIAIQVTSTGEVAQQAEWMSDQAREAILGRTAGDWKRPITVSGAKVIARTWAMTDRVDQEYGVWQSVSHYRLLVSG